MIHRTLVPRHAALLLLGGLLTACSGEEVEETGEVVYTPVAGPIGPNVARLVCSPQGGVALEFVVGASTGDCNAVPSGSGTLQMNLWAYAAALEPGSYDFDSGNAFAAYDADGSEQVDGLRDGTLTVVAWNAEALSAQYVVRTVGALSVEGSFEARWCPDMPTNCD